MKKTVLLGVLFTIATLFLAACSPAVTEATVEPVNTAPAVRIAEGRLLPANWLDQSFALPGQVAEVLVKDGEAVTAGQTLARLADSPEARLALARAQQEVLAARQALDALQTAGELNLAQAELARIAAQEALDDARADFDVNDSDKNKAALDQAAAALKLAEDKITKLQAGNGVDPDAQAAAEARLAAANAALISAQAAVDALELKASMDGVVVEPVVQAGQRVNAGQPVLTVADFSGWVVKTDNLTETDVTHIAAGQTVTVVLDALPDMTFTGEISHIGARYEEKRGDITYTVTITLTRTDPAMRWGMTAAVRFAQ